MKRQQLIADITEQLAILNYKIQLQNALNLTDVNVHAENFFRELLNLLYGLKLRNCNAGERNAAAIDLQDEENRIAIQVTSNRRREKIQHTVDSFCQLGLHEKFDRLVVLLLGDPKSYRGDFFGQDRGDAPFSVRAKEDVWDTQRLVRDIANLELGPLDEVHQFVHRELSVGVSSQRKFQSELPAHRQLSRIMSHGRDVCFTIQKSQADAMEKLQEGMQRLQVLAFIAFYDTCVRTRYQDFAYLGSILLDEDATRVTFSFEVTCHVTHFVTAYQELLGLVQASDDSILSQFDLNFRTMQPVPLTVAESIAYRGRLVGPSAISIEIEKPVSSIRRSLRTSELLKLISQIVRHEPLVITEFEQNEETSEILEYFARANDSGNWSLDDFELDTSNAEQFRLIR